VHVYAAPLRTYGMAQTIGNRNSEWAQVMVHSSVGPARSGNGGNTQATVFHWLTDMKPAARRTDLRRSQARPLRLPLGNDRPGRGVTCLSVLRLFASTDGKHIIHELTTRALVVTSFESQGLRECSRRQRSTVVTPCVLPGGGLRAHRTLRTAACAGRSNLYLFRNYSAAIRKQ